MIKVHLVKMLTMYSWAGRSRRDGEPQEDEDPDPAAVAAAIAKLDQLYAAGKPLFAKDSIRYILEQIKKPLVRGDTISVIGLDGVKVDFDVDIGNVTPRYDDENPGQELIV